MKKTIIFIVFVAFMVLLPLGSVRAAEKIAHPFEDSVLLMISNHMRLNGDVESANVGNGHLLSVPIKQFAQQDKNEIDILIELYASQIAGLRRSGNHSPELENQLINSLEDKVNDLKERAPKLVEVRRSGRRGGFFGFIGRIAKAVGRGTGWVMGKTMEGAGKVVQFGIEEVAPKVLEKVVVGGNPLGAALFRTVARDLLIKRVEVAIIREVEKRAERGSELDPVAQATEDDKYQDLDDELDLEEDEDTTAPQGVLVYEFTKENSANYEDASVAFTWAGMGDVYCKEARTGADSFIVHLEFDMEAMTVSGWMSGSGQLAFDWDGRMEQDVQGNFQTTFSDLPLIPGSGSTAWNFSGEGLSTVSFGGTILCSELLGKKYREDLTWYYDYNHYYLDEQISLADHPTQILGHVYIPSDGRGLRFESFTDPVDEFTNYVRLTTSQPMDLLAP